jgi:hypothetical protein
MLISFEVTSDELWLLSVGRRNTDSIPLAYPRSGIPNPTPNNLLLLLLSSLRPVSPLLISVFFPHSAYSSVLKILRLKQHGVTFTLFAMIT